MKRILVILFFLSTQISFSQTPELIFVFLNKRSDKAALPEEEVKKIMDGHMANIERLAKEGKLISAGPFDAGGGIFIFKSKSVAEVNEWLSTDPGVKRKPLARGGAALLSKSRVLHVRWASPMKWSPISLSATYQTLPSSTFNMRPKRLRSTMIT
jgi:uncharacterized protein YciI